LDTNHKVSFKKAQLYVCEMIYEKGINERKQLGNKIGWDQKVGRIFGQGGMPWPKKLKVGD
jgi:hypothetical protein